MGLLDFLADPQFRRDVRKNAGDLAQSASNTIAETVTTPVDLAAWLLRKSGVPVPQNPVMGSDWAKQQGFMPQVDNGIPKLTGEALGLLAPLMATKQGAAATAGLLNKYADNLVTSIPTSGSREAQRGVLLIEKPSLADFKKMVESGKLNQATGVTHAGEDIAKTPMEMGLLNNYGLNDIAHFYASRSGFGKIKPSQSYDPLKEGYEQYVNHLAISPEIALILERNGVPIK